MAKTTRHGTAYYNQFSYQVRLFGPNILAVSFWFKCERNFRPKNFGLMCDIIVDKTCRSHRHKIVTSNNTHNT